MTGLNDASSISQELLPPFWISWHVALAGVRPGEPSGVAAFAGDVEWDQ